MPTNTNITRTHVRVVRSDGREWPTMAIAYRELIGTPHQIGSSEHQRIRSALRGGAVALDRHGFTWSSAGGTIPQETISWSDFTFGVELELLTPMGLYGLQDAVRNLPFANGWKVVRDGSLHSERGLEGAEVVSPVLQGLPGLEVLKQMLDWLRANGCRVNSSCGMHVHIGVRGMKVERVRKIVIAFLNNEQHFDSIVPPGRRNNRYCQSNLMVIRCNGMAQQLSTATSLNTIGRAVNNGNAPQHYNPYRYYKLNLQSFLHHGTVEFRQHSGTVESEKACSWVRLIAGFCAAAAGSAQQQIGERVEFEQFLDRNTDEAGKRFFVARRNKFAALAA